MQSEQRFVDVDGRVRWVLHGVTIVPGATADPPGSP